MTSADDSAAFATGQSAIDEVGAVAVRVNYLRAKRAAQIPDRLPFTSVITSGDRDCNHVNAVALESTNEGMNAGLWRDDGGDTNRMPVIGLAAGERPNHALETAVRRGRGHVEDREFQAEVSLLRIVVTASSARTVGE